MLIPMVVMWADETRHSYPSSAVHASVMVCGLTAVLQDLRAGRIGLGHVMAMGASGTFSQHNHGA